jgi:hypothetical protein
MPGRRRAKVCTKVEFIASDDDDAFSGVHSSVGENSVTKRAGITPITSCGSRSISTVCPTTAASPPNRRCHSAWPSTATLAFSRSSSSVNVRPNAGAPPSSSNSPADTAPVMTVSGCTSPPSARSRDHNPSTASACCRRSRNRRNVPGLSGLRLVHSGGPGGIRNSCTSRLLWGKGSGRTMVAFTTLSTAQAAPMTSARVATTTAV